MRLYMTESSLIGGEGGTLRDFSVTPAPYLRPPEAEREARLSILQRIRANVPDDFLIVCNSNWRKLPISAPYINGSFMETSPKDMKRGYTRDDIITIETKSHLARRKSTRTTNQLFKRRGDSD